ncbi:hypothetical protein PIB30_003615 [Stylosanthes scabra]|uniref:Uncharacterized protein n=1 Tax=Stylosanthes scabra TaxID=79078 RepID=A0ABU6Y2X4_9FABA|nr:hypothetical protein [Stylosanthes scabra]
MIRKSLINASSFFIVYFGNGNCNLPRNMDGIGRLTARGFTYDSITPIDEGTSSSSIQGPGGGDKTTLCERRPT